MRRYRWIIFTLLMIMGLVLYWQKRKTTRVHQNTVQAVSLKEKDPNWTAPDSNSIPSNATGDLIRYGKELIRYTSRYLGPNGSVAHFSNGMNCQNCHLNAGTRAWAGNFATVASVFPRISDRRGGPETLNQRITDCFERSLNGRAPDSNSREMKAMNAYILWVGKDVVKGKKPKGTGLEMLAYIERPADPQKGKQVFIQKCQRCHGANGQGQPDSVNGYKYPPLWGDHSYNKAAGLFRLTKFTGFIRKNMPYESNNGINQLTDEEAWDVAAFVNSQPRPDKKFKRDWPNILLKPVDLPEGPFPDSYPVSQHKYGPFAPIARYKKNMAVNHKK